MSAINRMCSAWMTYVNTEIQLNDPQGRSRTFNLYEFRFNSFTPTLFLNSNNIISLFCKKTLVTVILTLRNVLLFH